ncbi:hypothetical protein CERSUDRAFT_110294 [Gelatoporia subvermispora B]|uniref:Endoplasmic reticulum protein n=1 Tax=Ceriporiopsis subvermispora (strain B) TaxID=914234 RepID=M2PXT1_CERS8|nr:hypothetical protein CERSUDRAFT_110294 [Gelatoporia subvermispora B]
MATTQHYMWAAGHFIVTLSALRYFIASLLFRGPSVWWYKTSFMGAILSYAIVCNKSLGTPQPNAAWVRRALADENVQYFLLSIYWWYSRPITLALLPFAIFSLFHVLTFSRTALMPYVLPQGPPATANGTPTPHPLQKKLQLWVKTNYDSAMRAVAFTELLIMLRVTVGAILFRNPFLMPILYAHFLRQRYYHSKFTQGAIALVNGKVEEYVQKPGTPPVAAAIWVKVKYLTSTWAGNVLVPQQGARRQ